MCDPALKIFTYKFESFQLGEVALCLQHRRTDITTNNRTEQNRTEQNITHTQDGTRWINIINMVWL
jgi:hypothetical protein